MPVFVTALMAVFVPMSVAVLVAVLLRFRLLVSVGPFLAMIVIVVVIRSHGDDRAMTIN